MAGKGQKYNEPLGLPRGSVRAILALLVAVPVPVLVLLAALGRGVDGEVMAFYSAVVLVVLKDYFGSRAVDTAGEPRDDDGDYVVGR